MDSLDVIRGKHKGKKAYLIASGPSLRKIDVKKATSDGITFVVNESALLLDKFDYYFITGVAVFYWDYFQEGVKRCKTLVFANPELQIAFDKIDKKNKYMFDRRFTDHNNYKFNPNDDKLIIGNSSIQCVTHLAYICGCDPLILMGEDLFWKDNKYCVERKWVSKNPRPPMDSAGRIIKRDGYTTEHGYDLSLNIWSAINQANPNLNILNASPVSRVKHWKTITL